MVLYLTFVRRHIIVYHIARKGFISRKLNKKIIIQCFLSILLAI